MEGNKMLHLTIKKKWFDMIKSGDKTEEYRDIKLYWIKRLKCSEMEDTGAIKFDNYFTHVTFYNGCAPSKKFPHFTMLIDHIDMGIGKEEWGAEPERRYFVIKVKST